MRIAILDDAYEESTSPLREVDLPADPARYLEGHSFEHVYLTRRNAVQRILELARSDFDVVMNLCDGAWDEDRPGLEVVQALERLRIPFTGADSKFYDPPREQMKLAAYYAGMPAPASVFATSPADVERAADLLPFPLIVKHPASYSSIGLTPKSRVDDAAALKQQASEMIGRFGSALIEAFIEGREFTALVAENAESPDEPITFQPVEFVFPEGESFKHFDLKWTDYERLGCIPCADDALSEQLRSFSARIFRMLRGTGYARCDIRMDAHGRLYFLEINPNCGVFYPPEAAGSADLILQHDPAGHTGFVDAILRAALNRVPAPKPSQLPYDRPEDFGLRARRAIAAGELIEPFEARPHVLVSRSHVKRTWDSERRAWFHRYAYPVTDELYVMWSDDPAEWKPINHSCDPNAWLSGLDLVARRDIAAGEEISMDYATFCNETMQEFACTCGTPACRGIIWGDDYLKPFVERYGDHVSDYVRRKRALSRPDAKPSTGQARPLRPAAE